MEKHNKKSKTYYGQVQEGEHIYTVKSINKQTIVNNMIHQYQRIGGGGGVQLGPLGTAATDWPIVPAPGDYDDGDFGGMEIGRGN
jgi:hypothetical protein